MSYQVLARKWRPRIFSEMVGQEHVLRALVNALDFDRLHHAYLFTGTRGVGKTTIARILAKCLNCEQGVSSTPCGECSACKSIAEGRFVDLIEVDAASRTKVEDTRELLDNVQYAPAVGRYKVYLIDEVHMLSTHSFNALLKTLEEPPPHVKFLLATTDPQKLPVTILSRCLQFNLKNLSPERIVEHLQYVVSEEQVPAEEAGLWALARVADGSMRDALSLTDQAIAHGGGKLTEAEVGAMLGTIDLTAISDIARALANRDATEALSVVQRMSEHAPDYMAALGDLVSVWHRVAIAQAVPDALDNRHGDYKVVLELSKALSREDVQLFYQIALLGRRDITFAPEHRAGFEMVLLRMLAFQPAPESRVDPPVPSQSDHDADTSSNPIDTNSSSSSTEEAEALVKKPEAASTMGSRVPEDISEIIDDIPAASVVETGSHASELAIPISPSISAPEPPPSTPAACERQVTSLEINEDEPLITETLLSFTRETQRVDFNKSAPEECFSAESVTLEPDIAEQIASKSSSNKPSSADAGEPFESKPKSRAIEKLGLALAEPKRWIDIYQGLSVSGVLQNTAANLVLIEVSGNAFRFELDINNSGMYEDSHQQRLAGALSDYFGQSVTAEIEVGSVVAETPLAYRERLRLELQAAAVDNLKKDINVRRIQDVFGGVLLENTVKLID
ncbi:MAG: DNA polymerase-3 subunit gamma/tau [Porticoccus sp.]|jgi:DNA polymerase-3 subunit gamma/tau